MIKVNTFFSELVKTLKEKNLTISTAESCTGGMIAQMITDVSGASEVFGLGIVSYSIEQKIKTLGVKGKIIEKYGVYSKETAETMAMRVRLLSESNIAVATTGIAGPGGGTDDMPVGTVFIAVDGEKGTYSERCRFEAVSREEIRELAAQKAAQLCIDYINRG